MKKTIFAISIAFLVVSCNKKEETKVENTPTTETTVTVDSTTATSQPETQPVDSAQVAQLATEGDPVTQTMIGDGRTFKITYKTKVEGDPIAVISENGKETTLNQTSAWAKGAVYADKDKKYELTAGNDKTTLKVEGKTIILKEK